MNIKEKLWNRIRELRKERNISQEQLAFKSKIHRTYLSSVERGLKNISVENIEKIANALDVEIRDLFN
jgi:transcriptional regulator with XRE-family HTH domain